MNAFGNNQRLDSNNKYQESNSSGYSQNQISTLEFWMQNTGPTERKNQLEKSKPQRDANEYSKVPHSKAVDSRHPKENQKIGYGNRNNNYQQQQYYKDRYTNEQPECSQSFNHRFGSGHQENSIYTDQKRGQHIPRRQMHYGEQKQDQCRNWQQDQRYEQPRARNFNRDRYQTNNQQYYDQRENFRQQAHFKNQKQNQWEQRPQGYHGPSRNERCSYGTEPNYMQQNQYNQRNNEEQRNAPMPHGQGIFARFCKPYKEDYHYQGVKEDANSEEWVPRNRGQCSSQAALKPGLFSKYKKVDWEDRHTEESDREQWSIRYQMMLDWIESQLIDTELEDSNTESTASSTVMEKTVSAPKHQQQTNLYRRGYEDRKTNETPGEPNNVNTRGEGGYGRPENTTCWPEEEW